MSKFYRVGHIYRDTAGWQAEGDEFLAWFRSGDTTLQNSGGVRFRDFVDRAVKDPESGRKVPAFFVLVTAQSRSQFHNPWDDVVDHVGGDIYYWGDAKHGSREKRFNEFLGNSRIEAAFNVSLGGSRNLTPPILHFTKPAVGQVRFNGLCWLSELQQMWFDDHGIPVKNFRLLLSVLDSESIDPEWLRRRAVARDLEEADQLAPIAWREAKSGRIRKRRVWANRIRKAADQVPSAGSEDTKVLDEIRDFTPEQFENFVVALVEKFPNVIPGLNHQIIRTQKTSDHGLDFFGKFTLPYPISYEISFIGEAKRQSSPVTPDQVSRLVARLGRGQYGLYFTTSFYTPRAQEEVIVDGYPVRLFAGADIINLLKAARCISAGKLDAEWKNSAIVRPSGPHSKGLLPKL